jgi:hypothetical protein
MEVGSEISVLSMNYALHRILNNDNNLRSLNVPTKAENVLQIYGTIKIRLEVATLYVIRHVLMCSVM